MLRQVRARSVLLGYDVREMGLINPNAIDRQQIIVLHGLLGARDGWRVFLRNVERSLQELGIGVDMHLVDFRHHGLSPNAPTYDSTGQYLTDCVMDLDAMIQARQHRRPRSPRPIIIGHSMGGKVALMYSLLRPERVRGVIALDAAPAVYTHSHQYLFEAMKRLNLDKVASRQHAIKLMEPDIPEANTRAFVATNLVSEQLLDMHKRRPRLTTFPPEARRAYEHMAYAPYGWHRKSLTDGVPFLPALHEDVSAKQTLPMCWRVNVDYLAAHEHHIHEWPVEYTFRTLENATVSRDGHFKLPLNLTGLESDNFPLLGDGFNTLDADIRHYYRAAKASSAAAAVLARMGAFARTGDEEGVAKQIQLLTLISEAASRVGVDIGLHKALEELDSAVARKALDSAMLTAHYVAKGHREYAKASDEDGLAANPFLDTLRSHAVDAYERTQQKLQAAVSILMKDSDQGKSAREEQAAGSASSQESDGLPSVATRSLRAQVKAKLTQDLGESGDTTKMLIRNESHRIPPAHLTASKGGLGKDHDVLSVIQFRQQRLVSAHNARYYPPGFAPKLDLTSALNSSSTESVDSSKSTEKDSLDTLLEEFEAAFSVPEQERPNSEKDTPLWSNHPAFTKPPELTKHVTYPGPVLFIGGRASTRLTTPDYIKDIPKFYPGYSLELLPGGHFVHNGEAAADCARLVASFIKAHMSMHGEF